MGRELDLAVYLYEAAQSREYRKNLSVIREGEYEGTLAVGKCGDCELSTFLRLKMEKMISFSGAE